MSTKANAKHHFALLLISLGALGVIGGVIGIATAIATGKAAGLVCGAVGGIPGVLLLWRGIRMRNSAVAAGSRVHLPEEGDHWTSHSGSAKPSFLKGKPPPRDDQW